jgi:SAM-dependent methyltransferase
MNMMDIVQRNMPAPWSEGDNIPWNDPEFSQRMLKEHLSQEHDLASRRSETIDQHVRFLHEVVMENRVGTVLDLGCGPGLYTHRLARLGHRVHGIDFSPASVAYAAETAANEGLSCTYQLGDLRQADFGSGCDLVMFIYGEFNVFSPENAKIILKKARAALKPRGRLVLEPSPVEHIRNQGGEPSGWFSSDGGLFTDRPHLMLSESFWDESANTATNRYYIIDAETGAVSRYAASYQAYTDAELEAMLVECGFTSVQFWPNLTGSGERSNSFIAISASAG